MFRKKNRMSIMKEREREKRGKERGK